MIPANWFQDNEDEMTVAMLTRRDSKRMNWKDVEIGLGFIEPFETIVFQVEEEEDIRAVQEYIIKRVSPIISYPHTRSYNTLAWASFCILFEIIGHGLVKELSYFPRFFVRKRVDTFNPDCYETEDEFNERTLFIH